MHITNAPKGYVCPICVALRGLEDGSTLVHQTDIFYKDELVTGFINSFASGGVVGNALIVPNQHFEHIYELPPEYGRRVFELLQKTATAMKVAYKCDGITTMQCNEPAGGQHAFHYHHHVMQRYTGDSFMDTPAKKTIPTKEEKLVFAKKLAVQLRLLT